MKRKNSDVEITSKWLIFKETLTDKERAYLKAVITPFRKSIEWIRKEYCDGTFLGPYYIIHIKLNDEYDRDLILPDFDDERMYAGMELDRKYSLNTLKL